MSVLRSDSRLALPAFSSSPRYPDSSVWEKPTASASIKNSFACRFVFSRWIALRAAGGGAANWEQSSASQERSRAGQRLHAWRWTWRHPSNIYRTSEGHLHIKDMFKDWTSCLQLFTDVIPQSLTHNIYRYEQKQQDELQTRSSSRVSVTRLSAQSLKPELIKHFQIYSSNIHDQNVSLIMFSSNQSQLILLLFRYSIKTNFNHKFNIFG